MPGYDRTGPAGQGPLTGRGLGPCGTGRRRTYGRGLARRPYGRGLARRVRRPRRFRSVW